MRSFSKLWMAGLAALGFCACSDNVDAPDKGEETGADKVYMSFNLELPAITRSATEETETGKTNSDANPDYEQGTDAENKVATVKVILATVDNGTYTYKAASSDDYILAGGKDAYTVTFESSTLEGIKGQDNIAVFVVCNPLSDFNPANLFTATATVADTDKDLTSSLAKSNSFLMANAEVPATISIPEDLSWYDSPSLPYDLGTVKVERAAARFDYKAVNNNVYPIMKDGEGADAKTLVNIKLTDVALMNLSKNYYYLRRVAPATAVGEYDAAAITLCGKETYNNFVVDTDAAGKLAGSNLTANFFYNVGHGTTAINPESSEFAYDAIAGITTDDNWTPDSESGVTDGYKVWRYVTENTLPAKKEGVQDHRYTTGVMFKGEIVDADGVAEADKLLNGTDNVYVFNNVLYGNWAKVKSAAEAQEGNEYVNLPLNAAYNAVAATITAGSEPDKAEAAKAGFTVYAPTNGKYLVYYPYWNRHNDNGTDSMGIMEFGVVRNNVYKLSVTSIERFGHPGDPTGDPDPEIPDDPDEDEKVYFRVGVQVLPWVVRVNNIEF